MRGKGMYVNRSKSHHSHGDCAIDLAWRCLWRSNGRERKRIEKGGREQCEKTRSPEAIAVLLLLETTGRNVFGFYLVFAQEFKQRLTNGDELRYESGNII